MLTLLLAACGAAPEVGRADACLGNDADDAWIGEGDRATFDVEGVYHPAEGGPDGVYRCSTLVQRRAAITDAAGVTWTLGWGVADPSGADQTPELDLEDGAEVTLRFQAIRSFGEASGFALSDADGLVAALEVGIWGPALEAGDVPVAVAEGEPVGTARNDCGTQEHRAVRFGDLDLAPFGSAPLVIDSVDYEAQAIASYGWREPMSCTDTAGQLVWGIWR